MHVKDYKLNNKQNLNQSSNTIFTVNTYWDKNVSFQNRFPILKGGNRCSNKSYIV